MTRTDAGPSTSSATEELLQSLMSDVPSAAARRLIVAAVAAFAARGYHATTTRDISTGAGMSPAAMYVHYPSKEDLLFATSKIAHEAAQAAIADSARGKATPATRLRAIVRDFTVWHAEHAQLARVAQYQLDALSVEHLAAIARIRRRTENAVRSEVQAGVDAGVFRVSDVATAARAVLSMGIDVARWFRPDGRMAAADLGEQYAELAVRMVGGAGRAVRAGRAAGPPTSP